LPELLQDIRSAKRDLETISIYDNLKNKVQIPTEFLDKIEKTGQRHLSDYETLKYKEFIQAALTPLACTFLFLLYAGFFITQRNGIVGILEVWAIQSSQTLNSEVKESQDPPMQENIAQKP